MVTRRYWPLAGGGATVMANLAAALRKEDVESTIITPKVAASWPDEIHHHGSRVVRLPISTYRAWRNIRYGWNLSTWLRRNANRFDLIYVSELKHEAAAAALAGRRSGLPVVLRAENSGFTGDCQWQLETAFGRRIKQHCFTAAALLAPSPSVQRELIAAGYPRNRIHYCHSGTPHFPRRTPELQTKCREVLAELGEGFKMPPDTPLAVFVGQLSDDKGLDHLVQAWTQVTGRWPNARLWLVGDGPQRIKLLAQVESLGLTGRETYDILGIADGLEPHERLRVIARREDGEEISFGVIARLDSDVDVEYYSNEGILHTVLRRMGAGDM